MGNSQSNEITPSRSRDRSGSTKETEPITAPSSIKKRSSIRRTRQVLTSSSPPRPAARKGSADTSSEAGDKLSLLEEPGSSVPQSATRRDSNASSNFPEGLLDELDDDQERIPVTIRWSGPASKVYIIGSFTHWRKKVYLTKAEGDKEFTALLDLPPGTHRLRFNVDGEWKTNENMSVATDSSGNFVNYIEATLSDEDLSLTRADVKPSNEQPVKVTSENWTNTIPSFMSPSEELLRSPSMIPPFLPPHLEKVILNTSNERKDDHSVLPHPNHVVLNHLAASSIRNGVLAVSASTRYRRKYVTTILYKPAGH